jgi:FixJ family two-component response regulator
LLSTFDLDVVAFRSAAEYLAYPKPDVPTCLVLDVELPDANGLDLQSQTGHPHPQIVFITGHGDIPKSVRAIKAGAVDFLTKPLNESDLIRAIRAAITQDQIARRERIKLADLRRRLSCLTPREREVLPLVVSGLFNKQAAAELGIGGRRHVVLLLLSLLRNESLAGGPQNGDVARFLNESTGSL